MRFSIIIPVYNVEKYIRRCMESVMGQTFRDYEVIVVDDESPDNSMRIVEEFAEMYPGMIIMLHQKNTRQGGARNRGVREATGEYILFVDSDDYVRPDMLEVVDQALREQPCDILSFRYRMVTSTGGSLWEGGFGSLQPGVYNPEEDKQILLLPAGPVHKAYRREFYLACDVWFPEKVLYEDAVVRLIFVQASSIVLLDECMYYYVQSNNSSIRQKPSAKMLDILQVTDLVLEEFRERGLYEKYKEPLEASLVNGIIYILDVINGADHRSELQKALVEYIISHFPDCRENPYVDKDTCRALDFLLNWDFSGYYYRVILHVRIKEWLLRWRWIAALNKLRWRLIAAKRGVQN